MPTDNGANAGLKVASLVGGMVAGADSIDDMALLRHGGMGRVFTRAHAPSTLGSFLRAFTFGHVRQLDAIASRFLLALAGLTRLLGDPGHAAAPRLRGMRCSTSTTPSSRSTATPSRAPGSATPVSATSTYFERDTEEDGDHAFRRYGHSKDHRSDLPQIVIGLAVTREGIPVRCWCWPGNTSDVEVLPQERRPRHPTHHRPGGHSSRLPGVPTGHRHRPTPA